MAEFHCGNCGLPDGAHERWCSIGQGIAEMAAKDRRIAELEAALKNFYAGHQGCSDPERNDCQCRDCLAYRAYKVGNTPALDAAIAAAKREALEEAAQRLESRGYVGAVMALRRMAEEVKP